MKEERKFFAGIAVGLVLACLLAIWFFAPRPDSGESDETQPPTQQTQPSATTVVSTIPTAPPPLEETQPPIVVPSTVTISQVPKPENERIDRSTYFNSTHPEYIDFGEDTSPYCCAEGCVFRNDKTISITIPDPMMDTTHTVSFGYITGKCNRFLYLNPVVESDPTNVWYFKFSTVGNRGRLLSLKNDVLSPSSSYTMIRTLDATQPSGYLDAQHPGTVWYTMAPLDGIFYVDVLMMDSQGVYYATLRLTIERAEDGTYSIVNLENRDLKYANHPVYTYSEMEHLLKLANYTVAEPSVSHITIVDSDGNPVSAEMDEVLFELLDDDTDLYFDHILPEDLSATKKGSRYTDMLIPVIAVTMRDIAGGRALTLYYHVVIPPHSVNGEHAGYMYIGRDYVQFDTEQNLRNSGYEGTDI